MKKFLMLFLAYFFAQTCFSAQIYSCDSLFGLKDDNGEIITKAAYKKLIQLEYTPAKTILIPMQATNKTKAIKLESYKALNSSDKWGVLSQKGKVMADFKYDDIKVSDYGEVIVVKEGEETILNPVKNTMKKTTKTLESIVGLPVTIVAGALMPIEVISKMGK